MHNFYNGVLTILGLGSFWCFVFHKG